MGGSIVTEVELEEIIERARIDRYSVLDLNDIQISYLPDSIGCLNNLTEFYIGDNQLICFPEIIRNFHKLTFLEIDGCQLKELPIDIGDYFSSIKTMFLGRNQLNCLPESIGSLNSLVELFLQDNYLSYLPKNIVKLSKLIHIDLSGNPLTDLSILQNLESLERVTFFDIDLPPRYWTKLSEWKPQWLLEEENAEIRRVLIQQIGYDRICQELDAIELDTWREYTLLKIDDLERIYTEDTREEIGREPMVLLKMTCPSTEHIHILRVPPEMTSAEAAITWVNHSIHPDQFIIQT
jgi:leucine-rich repeat protein SHOC2